MTTAGRKYPRRDRAVVMARGLSLRMGVPKGLLRLSDTGPTFIRIIADLYLTVGMPVDVVTREETAVVYRRELAGVANLRVLAAEGGGDTVLTLLNAWRASQAGDNAGSHFWAHPVDLPLVTDGTISQLAGHSRREPDRIIRPVRQGVPGHPVILPTGVLADLNGEKRWRDRPLRDFIAHTGCRESGHSPLKVEVADPGVVRDFDRPEDFSLDRS